MNGKTIRRSETMNGRNKNQEIKREEKKTLKTIQSLSHFSCVIGL